MSFKTRALLSLLLVLVLSQANAFTALASSERIDFSMPPFNDSIIRRQGDALVSKDSIHIAQAYQVGDPYQSVGWATYSEPMRLWDKATGSVADFTTQFTFVINSQGNTRFADGMTFFFVPNGSQLSLNSIGGNLAVVDQYRDRSNSSTWFVAVEFDTFYNRFDPNCSHVAHVGIDLNSLNSANYSCVDWFNDKIMSGGRIKATITYNSSMQNLSVLMIDAEATSTDINSSAIDYKVNLIEYLLERVTFGFSAVT